LDSAHHLTVEQGAYWFRNRDTTGLIRHWPNNASYQVFAQLDLLREVRAVLKKYEKIPPLTRASSPLDVGPWTLPPSVECC
jgi:hypothetical protein